MRLASSSMLDSAVMSWLLFQCSAASSSARERSKVDIHEYLMNTLVTQVATRGFLPRQAN